ncbi:MAG TPA: low temperature requirement protein A [Ferruginibacter sp.]|nr:low temperature requirement protein A [Ferruginibacter sp.]
MKYNLQSKQWWGAPKKIAAEKVERKISWLELFYDLVYVIAISTITHKVATHFTINALLDYFFFFVIIYWGWLNGSLYHDLHGSEGLRTKLLTLWQMTIVAALVITLHDNSGHQQFNTTVVLLIMQLYITYLWWSVGLYDKAHRKLNKPYTIIYLIAFVFICSTLFVSQAYSRTLLYISLLLNCMPPFVSHFILKRNTSALTLTSSMTERLGLFTIIVFGEVVLGVINGIIAMHNLNATIWFEFVLAISIVFALWWLFFTIISDRKCKNGLLYSSLLELLFIPTLIGLDLLGASFTDIFLNFKEHSRLTIEHTGYLGYSVSIFLLGIWAMMYLLKYPEVYLGFKKIVKRAIILTVTIITIFACLPLQMNLVYYLLVILLILLSLIFYLNNFWYRMVTKKNYNT